MNTVDSKPIVTWLILVYDRAAAERFPFKRKWHRFNYARSTDAEAQEVLRLCAHKRHDEGPPPDMPVGETRVSHELGGSSGTSKQILQYRHLFDYVADENNLFADAQDACAFLSVALAPNSYFEDETQHPISLVQVFDEEAKRKHGAGAISIVLDEPESILRCGPAEPIRPELWKPAHAELMAHLSDVYAQLARSRWLQARCVVSAVAKEKYNAVLPVHEDCMAVILPFRQLYSKGSADDLFNRCCKIHSQHCPRDHPAYDWVNWYRTRFNAFLDQPVTAPFSKSNLPPWRYLDAFAYGAKVVHASGKKHKPATDLDALLAGHAKEMVVMEYHYILRTLLGYVSMVIPVLRHNVTHWTNDLGWAGKSSPAARDLFEAR
ncbi:MAG: hypothetical protein KAY37_01290 [Phycisphaerae bacterium]|nr:hypothetical protein [Phycisphaerae bacterium]